MGRTDAGPRDVKIRMSVTSLRQKTIPVPMTADHEFTRDMVDVGENVVVRNYVSYRVVPKGKARIRTQVSAAHTSEEIDRAVAASALASKRMDRMRVDVV